MAYPTIEQDLRQRAPFRSINKGEVIHHAAGEGRGEFRLNAGWATAAQTRPHGKRDIEKDNGGEALAHMLNQISDFGRPTTIHHFYQLIIDIIKSGAQLGVESKAFYGWSRSVYNSFA